MVVDPVCNYGNHLTKVNGELLNVPVWSSIILPMAGLIFMKKIVLGFCIQLIRVIYHTIV